MNKLIRRNCIDVSGILDLEDDKFIEQLYKLLLNREGDKIGIKGNLEALKRGMSRAEVVLNMASSEEAVIKNVAAIGMKEIAYKTLMKYDGAMFVENVYLSVLGRHVDESGYKHVGMMYEIGLLSKIELLYNVRNSAEGVAKGVNVKGLNTAYKWFKLRQLRFKIPFIGKICRAIRDVELLKMGMRKLAMDLCEINSGNGVLFNGSNGTAQFSSNLEERIRVLEMYSKEIHTTDMSQEVYDIYQYLCSHERIGK